MWDCRRLQRQFFAVQLDYSDWPHLPQPHQMGNITKALKTNPKRTNIHYTATKGKGNGEQGDKDKTTLVLTSPTTNHQPTPGLPVWGVAFLKEPSTHSNPPNVSAALKTGLLQVIQNTAADATSSKDVICP